MGLIATYDPVLGRVQLAGTVLGAGATQVYVWRSKDNFLTSDVLRGGLGAPMSGGVFNIDDYEFPPGVPIKYQMTSYNAGLVQQASFTTASTAYDVDRAWLKSLARPFLNQQVTIQDMSDISAPARGTVFPIVGRSRGISVSDVRSGREFAIVVNTENAAAEINMRALLASGDPILLQVPSADEQLVPTGYYAVGDSTRELAMRRSPRRYWTLPLTEIAPPGPDVLGASVTWQGVVNQYATWNAVIAAKATWNDVLQLISNPSEVIVP